MFRLEEVFWGGWQDKTIEAMRKRRYKQNLERLEPLGAERLDALTSSSDFGQVSVWFPVNPILK